MENLKNSAIFAFVMTFVGMSFAQLATAPSVPSVVELNIVNAKRTVNHWKVGARYEKTSTKYYWAAFSEGRYRNIAKRTIDSAGVEVLGHCWVGKTGLYKVKLKGTYAQAIAGLKNHPGFVNLISVELEEKVSPAIWNLDKQALRRSFARIDSSLVKAEVYFHDSAQVRDLVKLVAPYADSIWYATTPVYLDSSYSKRIYVAATQKQLKSLAVLEEVVAVTEYYPALLTNDASRTLTRVTNLQNPVLANDTNATPPPLATWLQNKDYTGEGIWVGIWDSGIDRDHWDFTEGTGHTLRQANITGNTAAWQDPFPPSWGHGTHVAGIAAGNGQRSRFWSAHAPNNGWNYQWRGLAPKAGIWAFNYSSREGHSADVNNHSTTSDDARYGSYDIDIDAALSNHDPTPGSMNNNVMVYSAGNEGLTGENTDQKGYFSMSCNAKNAIKVGSVEKYTGIRSDWSSMGPTRDGRIGPDIVAPGGSGGEVWDIIFDSVSIKNGVTRTISHTWQFNPTDPHWGDVVDCYRQNIRNRTWYTDGSSNTVFEFITGAADSWVGGAIYSDALAAPFTTTTQDTLILRWKIAKLDNRVPGDSIHVKLYWHSTSWNNPVCRCEQHDNFSNFFLVGFTAKVASGWQVEKIWLNNPALEGNNSGFGWTAGNQIDRVRLDFVTGDTRDNGIISCNYGANNYMATIGTSMSAPHVTGIVALMLQKYQRYYLQAGQNIHDNPFWNSTAKAILIHTATDLVSTQFTQGHVNNFDFANGDITGEDQLTAVYDVGPDWATGYGLVNAEKAINYVDPTRFKEGNILDHQEKCYYITVPAGTANMRVTLAWDDPAPGIVGNPYDKKLQNDLDLSIINLTTGQVALPWTLDYSMLHNGNYIPTGGNDYPDPANGHPLGVTRAVILANPAFKGKDHLNNVEVVDISSPGAGKWMILVDGYDITTIQNPTVSSSPNQDYSLVADFPLTLDVGQTGLNYILNSSGQTMARLSVSGDLLLRNIWMPIRTPASGSLQFYKGSLNCFIDPTGAIHSNSVNAYAGPWLDISNNLRGCIVYRRAIDNLPLMSIGSDGVINLRGDVKPGFTF
jgi:hypothetical protein